MPPGYVRISRKDIDKARKPTFIQSLIPYNSNDDDEITISKRAHCEVCKYTRLYPDTDKRIWKCPTCGLETPFSSPVRRATSSKLVVADKPNPNAPAVTFSQKTEMRRDAISKFRDERKRQATQLDGELHKPGYQVIDSREIIRPSQDVITATEMHHSKRLQVKSTTPRGQSSDKSERK